ncbi:hypothetical protein N184_23655 [Sinorhizobium sp. GL28]|nr:hypothetical protein N184_23655 [Sinorhizobium sp. GL28]
MRVEGAATAEPSEPTRTGSNGLAGLGFPFASLHTIIFLKKFATDVGTVVSRSSFSQGGPFGFLQRSGIGKKSVRVFRLQPALTTWVSPRRYPRGRNDRDGVTEEIGQCA